MGGQTRREPEMGTAKRQKLRGVQPLDSAPARPLFLSTCREQAKCGAKADDDNDVGI